MLRKKQITKKNKEAGPCIVTTKKIGKSSVGILEETTQTEHSKQNKFLQNVSKKKKIGIQSQTMKKMKNKDREHDQSVLTMTTRHVNHEKPNFLKKIRGKSYTSEREVKLGTSLVRKPKVVDSVDNVDKRLSDEENTILRTDTSISTINMDNTESRTRNHPWEADDYEYKETKTENENGSTSKESRMTNFLCMSMCRS